LKALFHRNRFFFWPALIILAAWLLVVLWFDKAGIHLAINAFHYPQLDIFFKYLTYFGDGWMVLCLSIVLLFVKYRYTAIFLVSNMLITLVVQISKKLIFVDYPRPRAFFDSLHELYFVPGVEVHSLHSFPSGHAATAFGIFLMLTMITRMHSLHILWILLAVLTAFSRVYLSQHFLADILAGALIGTIITFLTFYYFNIFVPNRLEGSLKNVMKSDGAYDQP